MGILSSFLTKLSGSTVRRKPLVLPDLKPWQAVESVFQTDDPTLRIIWKIISNLHYLPPNFPPGKVVFSDEPNGSTVACYDSGNQIIFFPSWHSRSQSCQSSEGARRPYEYSYDVPIHELGHAIDRYLCKGAGTWSASQDLNAVSWRNDIKRLIEKDKKMRLAPGEDSKYKYNWGEIFARCYVMWIALHTDNPRIDATVNFNTCLSKQESAKAVRRCFGENWYFSEQEFWDYVAPHFYRMLGPWHLWKTATIKV